MRWIQASEKYPPMSPKRVFAVYDDGNQTILGYAFSESDGDKVFIKFEIANSETYLRWIALSDHPELFLLKWLDEQTEADHIRTLKAYFVRELKAEGLITDGQLGAILNHMGQVNNDHVKTALKIVTDALQKDKSGNSMFNSWKSTLALSFFDEVRNSCGYSSTSSIPSYEIPKDMLIDICNSAAKIFLESLCK